MDESVRALLINAGRQGITLLVDLTEMNGAVNDGDTESYLYQYVEWLKFLWL